MCDLIYGRGLPRPVRPDWERYVKYLDWAARSSVEVVESV
jgi:hypothetical protein